MRKNTFLQSFGRARRLLEDCLRAKGGPRPHPAFLDLDPAGRAEAHTRAASARVLEAALDPEGLSSTARAILARLRAG